MSPQSIKCLIASPRLITVTLLGFSSGLPLALTSSALEARFASAGVSLETIGFLTLIGLPYVLKPLWAPLMDNHALPFLGLRRGWMLFCQLLLMSILIAMSLFRVEDVPILIALLGLALAFCSASQDIAIDAYRTEILRPEERGLGVGCFVGAYRVAMLLSGSFGFILADKISWEMTYFVMAMCMGVGVLTTLSSASPSNEKLSLPVPLLNAYVAPLKEFFSRPHAWSLLLIVVLYKFGDTFAQKLMTTFFIRGLDFTVTEIGMVNKLGGFFALLMGLFFGGFILARLSLYRALILFGVLQVFSNLFFVILALVGHNMSWFIATVVVENFTGGMGNSAYFALIMSLCNTRFTATQFALLSAISAIPREILGPLAGYIAANYGWLVLYELAFLSGIPVIFLLLSMQKNRHFFESTHT